MSNHRVLIKIKQDEMIVTASSSGVTFKVRPEYQEGTDTKDPDRTASWRAQDGNELRVFEEKEEVSVLWARVSMVEMR